MGRARSARALAIALLPCALGACGAPQPVDLPEGSYRVFATSDLHVAALGGPAGADALCADRAGAAGLEGTFAAWLSTLEVDVRERLAHGGPYVRLDGEIIAETWDDLLDGAIAAPISLDEYGNAVSGDVWTGTLPDGSAYPADDCGGFTIGDASARAQCGDSTASDSAWTERFVPLCSTRLRVYCIEQ